MNKQNALFIEEAEVWASNLRAHFASGTVGEEPRARAITFATGHRALAPVGPRSGRARDVADAVGFAVLLLEQNHRAARLMRLRAVDVRAAPHADALSARHRARVPLGPFRHLTLGCNNRPVIIDCARLMDD